MGDIARAESLFKDVLPRLDALVRRWFEEPWVALGGSADHGPGDKPSSSTSQTPFWETLDPDPTTPENEFRLEYWSRVAHAFLLFDDPLEPRFDARAMTYIQYGRPATAALRGQPDVVEIENGAALFTARPPRSQRLGLLTMNSQFEGQAMTRLSTQVHVYATQPDSAVARWLVYDSTGREVARETQVLDRSACTPESLQFARFAADLTGGSYRVVVSASDGRHRRGLRESIVSVSAAARDVGLSDVVAVCSQPTIQLQGDAVFLEAAEIPRVRGEQALSCYFEIARLSSSPEHRFRFQYHYQVQRLADGIAGDARAAGPILSEYASEEIDVGGPLRRQFVTIPARALAPDRYRLTIRVHDQASGLEAQRSLDFTKD
jgi:GWxTD domain-containing protein